MYHHVLDPAEEVYTVGTERFREHLDEIERATRRPPALAHELTGPTPPAGAWMITFDDGGSSGVHVGEELSRRSWRGHFFIQTDVVGQAGFLDWDEVRGLTDMGHVIGSHSCSHPDRMADLSWEQLLDEWSRSGQALAEALGRPIPTASVPGGLYSRSVGRAAAQAGFSTLFTSLPSQRVRSIDGCRLIGRYAIRSDTGADEATAAAAGRSLPWARQRAAWRLRGAVKTIAGRRYESLRRRLLARR
jgi:peptidoglycan/xylan/chitin deacetylase (PgdA/CDA1 family)